MSALAPSQEIATEQLVALRDYAIRREQALDRDLLPYGDPRGKDVLVFGAGMGADVLWAARREARSIVALDVSVQFTSQPFEMAMAHTGISHDDWEFLREDVHDFALSGRRFDLIVSNGTFEHIHDLKGVLSAFRPLLRESGRIAIFADGLWYSSIGGHIGKGPWEHLLRSPGELKAEINAYRWHVLCSQLNRMTAVDFLEAISNVGLLVLQMRLGHDPNLGELPSLLPRIRAASTVSPTHLSIVSIGCELCFPEHL